MSVPFTPHTTPPAPAPRRRWLRRVLVSLVLLVLVLAAAAWFAPAVVANTNLRNRVARVALADLRGDVEVGGASLGWLSAVELRDVTVKDAQGRTLLSAPKITSSKTLLALARDRANLGEFAVERPVAEVVCEKGTTNLEDALANYLKDSKPPAATRTALAVRVTGGKLTVRDPDAGTTSELDAIDAAVNVPAPRSEPVTAKVAAVPGGGASGKLDADVTLGDRGTAKLAAAGFPLGTLAPALRRVAPGVSLSGSLTADLTASWGKDDGARPTASVEGTASAREFELGGPWFNGDRLKLAAFDLPLKVEVVGNGVRVERADLTCDVGTLHASGSADTNDSFDNILDQAGLKVTADIDLAKLAAKLPRLLRLRPGTAVTEGHLAARLASHAGEHGTTWDGAVTTKALKGVRDGKPLEWAEPLYVEFVGRIPAGHLPTFDKFVCKSDFAAVNAQGSAEAFRGAANFYLDRLTDRLGEFVDLKGITLRGEASVWVTASRSPQGAFKLDGGVDLKQFRFADGHAHSLDEAALAVKVSAAGLWQARGPIRVDAGSATVTAGPDSFTAKLTDPIPDAKKPAGGTAQVLLTGDLTRWVGRARRFVSIPPEYVFGGSVAVKGVVRAEPGVILSDGLRVLVERAVFRGAGLDINEPTLDATANARVTRAGGAEFNDFTLKSPVLSVTAGKLAIETPVGAPMVVSGSGDAVSDLTRLGKTLKLSTDPRGSDAFRGRAAGPVRFRWQGDTTTFGGTLDVKNFAYGQPQKTGIEEAALKLDLDAQYDETPDRVTFTRARVERPGLAIDAKGLCGKVQTTRDVALDGTLTYDLAALTPELRAAIGGGFAARGAGSKPFAVHGTLSPGAGAAVAANQSLSAPGHLTADAGVAWDDIKAYGFDVGPSELTVKVANGTAAVSPITAAFGGGKVTLTPTVRLDPAPVELLFAPGRAVDHAKLTPAACAGALGFALPVIANAAHAEGEISATLDDSHVPLADFTKTSARGQLLVHRATVGAGPVVTEIVKLLGQSSASITLANEMTVPVRVEGGRVYHENFAVTVNGFVLKTSGSVGFDGSLSMVADVPIPGTFPGMKNNPSLKTAIEGKVVKVPIAGTMAQPAIDPSRFQAAIADLARGAVRDVGKGLINKELEKIVPGGLNLPGGGKSPGGAKLPFDLPFGPKR